MLVGQPAAGLDEVLAEVAHHEVYHAARGAADKTSERVLAHLERHRGVVVVVERAEAFMSRNSEPEPLRDPLDGEVAKLLKFEFIHKNVCWGLGEGLLFQVFFGLGIQSRLGGIGDELAVLPLI